MCMGHVAQLHFFDERHEELSTILYSVQTSIVRLKIHLHTASKQPSSESYISWRLVWRLYRETKAWRSHVSLTGCTPHFKMHIILSTILKLLIYKLIGWLYETVVLSRIWTKVYDYGSRALTALRSWIKNGAGFVSSLFSGCPTGYAPMWVRV